jgi:tetratricopeptide (TPR) repeat protein
MRVVTTFLWVFVFVFGCVLATTGCEKAQPLQPRSLTWAELRTVRQAVTITPPGESERSPYPKERLVDGTIVSVAGDGLVWVRRDTGATFLVQGPATFVSRADTLEASAGRYFVDTPPGATARLSTPHGSLHLADVRASLNIQSANEEEGGEHPSATAIYVLRGEVRTETSRAQPGERLTLTGAGDSIKTTVSPERVWVDWTGGLATTDRSPAPAPYGIGTVGARAPGAKGTPRAPLAIHSLDLDVKIDGDFAVTEVSQVFFNASSEKVEGLYRFRTPVGAGLQRFGVSRGGDIAWGRIKEKSAASAQYSSNVYEGSNEDPALLEWEGPGVYTARLYPILPGESRRVVVRYTEWLHRTGERGERRLYIYPMAAEGAEATLPHIEEMRARFDLGSAEALEVRSGMEGTRRANELLIQAQDFVPRADLAVELFDEGSTGIRAYRAEHELDLETLPIAERAGAEARADDEPDYLLLPLRPQQLPVVEGGLDLVIVVDASAATDESALALARATTKALLSHLGPDDRVLVAAGADGLTPVTGATQLVTANSKTRGALLSELARLRPGGATDLGKMLTEAARALDPKRRGAVIYIGDGNATVGELTLAQIRERLAKEPRPARVFALGVGDEVDMTVLAGIENGGFAERLNDANAAARAALRVLERAEQRAALGVSVDLGQGIERVFPRETRALLADEGLIVVGRLTRDGGAVPTHITISGHAGTTVHPLAVENIDGSDGAGDLRHRWATARLRQMMDENEGRAAMVDLGSRYGIVTPVTSFYVPTMSEQARERRELAQAEADADEEEEEDDGTSAKSGTATAAASAEPARVNAPSADARLQAEAAANLAKNDSANARALDQLRAAQGSTGKTSGGKARHRAKRKSRKKAVAAPGDPLSLDGLLAADSSALSAGARGGGLSGGGLSGIGRVAKTGSAADASPQHRTRGTSTRRTVVVTQISRTPVHCSAAADLPLKERIVLWRERLRAVTGHPFSVSRVYRTALRQCEAPDWRSRRRLLSMLLDSLPRVSTRVNLWRLLFNDLGAADILYRAIVARVRTADEMRQFHAALGLRTLDTGLLEALLRRARTPAARVQTLQQVRQEWPDDFTLALTLLDALEDLAYPKAARGQALVLSRDSAANDSNLRDLAIELRARPDATTAVRTAVGELHLRLAAYAKQADDSSQEAADVDEAKRAFGEIVEFAPDDPVARRRLGDLLRAHGWYAEARRQYETLALLVPDDNAVAILIGAAAEGQGRLEEAVQWTERGGAGGDPTDTTGPAATARALALTYLAWGREEALKDGRTKELAALVARTKRVRSASAGDGPRAAQNAAGTRVSLSWDHPDFHPTLWSDARGAPMPAAAGDVTLGISEVVFAAHREGVVEVRVEDESREHLSRLGVEAVLTVIFNEAEDTEKIHRLPVKFTGDGPSTLRFTLQGDEVTRAYN